MAISKRRLLLISIILSALIIVLAAFFFNRYRFMGNEKAVIGHTGSPLTASLYASAKGAEWSGDFSLVKFSTSADVAYALLAGDLKAGFVEPSKVIAVRELPGFKKLAVIGKVIFPYGATLVTRKDLSIRLNEVTGRKIAISGRSCKLYHAFKSDAARLGVDPKQIVFAILPFDSMIPALEAGEIDGAVLKGSYSALARKLGHQVLYQNWDVEAGDECCPAVIAQMEFILLAQKDDNETVQKLLKLLAQSEKLNPQELRKAVSGAVNIPLQVLEEIPIAIFEPADDSLLSLLVDHYHEEGHEDEEHEKKENSLKRKK